MVLLIVLLLVVAGVVALAIVRPYRPSAFPMPVDRDRERQLAELRGLAEYRDDLRMR